MTKPQIAYYAPLKPPDHPIPSGDRQMARMLLAALNKAGYDARLASRYISYSKRPNEEYLEGRKNGALEEAQLLLNQWRKDDYRPDLWFCYHPYDKSPDWLGMEICTELNIPMVTAEPCKTGQGPNGEWVPWRKEAQLGISMADMNIVMTHSDEAYLHSFIAKEKIVWMPPFVDVEMLRSASVMKNGLVVEEQWKGGRRLLCAGMMRPGAKMDSYRMLAASLKKLQAEDWSLVIVGGGPGEKEVRRLFDWDHGSRVNILGEVSSEEVLLLMEHAQVLSWPGCREAYGMVYLEAASRGCVSVGIRNLGVPLVVEHQLSGLLASPPDITTYTDCLKQIIRDDDLLNKLSDGAKTFISGERSGETTGMKLKQIIDPILARV